MLQIIEYAGLACLPLFIILDVTYRHRKFETTRAWRLRALAVTAVTFALSIGITLFWGRILGDRSLVDGSALGIIGGALVGILVYELIHYWYHRAAHRSDFLWRWAHQMHHSAESLDAFGAYYLHPIDTFFFTTWSSLVFFPLLGLRPEAGALGAAFLTFNAMFQHANIKTPRWIGYFIQRPESHGVHHERGVHKYNYSDLPLWDMVFGTFDNPATWEAEAGFYKGASSRVGSMLIGRDVSNGPASEIAVEDESQGTVDAGARRAA
ncbi:MAG: sterol desaturase family protein [Candidatus Latescibacterota bacterium]|jgi:sterol desaturase/sphingolipid hydroxylase (fatty acid hydroxylase superfamily)